MYPLVLLAACNLDKVDQVVDGATAPIVAQGLFLGLEDSGGVDLSGAGDLAFSSLCEVFLADVTDPADLASAPVEGVAVRFRDDDGTLRFREQGDGKYTLDSTDGLAYAAGIEPTVLVAPKEDTNARITVETPEAPDVDLPATLARNTALTVEAPGYDNLMVAAYDVDRSAMRFENLPTGVEDVYDFTHPDEPVESVEIPSDAFHRPGLYVIAVAGMTVGDPATFEGVNTSMSAFMAGQVALRLVNVTD